MEEKNFLDELLDEIELKEGEQTEAYFDLLLLQIKQLNDKIEKNFTEAEKECQIINSFTLIKNSQLAEKIKILEFKLKAFIIERKEKTIDLPNGTLKFHKKPDRVEISDLPLFIINAAPELVTIIPEQVKPNLNNIKAFIKKRPVPPGIIVIEGKEEFSYKLKGVKEDAREKEDGSGIEQTCDLRAAI